MKEDSTEKSPLETQGTMEKNVDSEIKEKRPIKLKLRSPIKSIEA